MEGKPLLPAAQYVRMSTEDQQYSIANQEDAIRTYAKKHGYVVVSTYADEGKSGIEIKHRKGLRRLLSDVVDGRAQYKAILVYDVSRWGRFQDVDEAAHYEFLCKSAGVPVRYCAEQFENDGSAASSIMKALKRTMAAEYSRELGVKVLAGQRRIALLGYRPVGPAGYGLRRMMVSPDGCRRIILKDGERKAVHTDRTILVPGIKKEVACVRRMFRLAAEGMTPRKIVKELNMRCIFASDGRPWRRSTIYRILKNESYAGCNTYGKTTQRLSSVSRTVQRSLWITHRDAFVPIVARETFDRVQNLLRKRGHRPSRSDASLIEGMKKVLDREGKLTHRILKKKGKLGSACYKRFGSIMKAYEMAGYQPTSRTVRLSNTLKKIRVLRKELYARLKQLFPNRVRFICLPGQKVSQVVEVDAQVRVAIYLCRTVNKGNTGDSGWVIRVRPLDRHLPFLICTVDRLVSKLVNFYVLPPAPNFVKTKILREDQEWFSATRRLNGLEDFSAAAYEIAAPLAHVERTTVIDDILIATDISTITLGSKDISLGPICGPIFAMLARNAGHPVSRDQLRKSVPQLNDPWGIDARIYTLRIKLGTENRKRIQTVPGIGYMYVSPGQATESRHS